MGSVNPAGKIVPPQATEEPAGGGGETDGISKGDIFVPEGTPPEIEPEAPSSLPHYVLFAPDKEPALSPFADAVKWDLVREHVPFPIRDFIIDEARLRPIHSLSRQTVLYSRLIETFYSNPGDEDQTHLVERFQFDPLNLNSVDPLETILFSKREEAENLLQATAAFNYASKYFADYLADEGLDQAAYQAALKKIIIARNMLLSDEKSPINNPTDLENLLEKIGNLLPSLWAELYYDSYLLSSPQKPDGYPDGDLPKALVWHLPSRFGIKEQDELFWKLITSLEGETVFSADQLVQAQQWLSSGFKDEVQREGEDYNYVDQMPHESFVHSEENPEGSFNYSDLKVPPTRDYFVHQSDIRLADTVLGKERILSLEAEISFRNDPVWEKISDQFMQEQSAISQGLPPYIPCDVGVTNTSLVIALQFGVLSSNIEEFFRFGRTLSDLSEPAIYLKERLQGIKNQVTPDLTTYFSKQTARLLESILEVIGQTDETGANLIKKRAAFDLDSESAKEYGNYFNQLFQLFKNAMDYLNQEETDQSVILQHTLEGGEKADVVLAEAREYLALPADLKRALALWNTYQKYKTDVSSLLANSVSSFLFQFLEHDIDASIFYVAIESVESANFSAVVTPEMLARVDQMELEAFHHLRNEQVVSFVNRLRYAIYYFRYRVEKQKALEERSKIPDFSDATSDPLADRIDDNIQRWHRTLDTGWPHANPNDSFSFFLDLDMFQNLLDTGASGISVELRVLQLTNFLTANFRNDGGEQNYYDFFCPLYLESDSAGTAVKGMRDHVAYYRLILVLKDIADYGEMLIASKKNPDPEMEGRYRDVIQVAKMTAVYLQDFLPDQPRQPFWVLPSYERIVPQKKINPSVIPSVGYGSPGEEALVRSQQLLFDVQTNPWDLIQRDNFFSEQAFSYELSLWVEGNLRYNKFMTADFEDFDGKKWSLLRASLISNISKFDPKAQLKIESLIDDIAALAVLPSLSTLYARTKLKGFVDHLNYLIDNDSWYAETARHLGFEEVYIPPSEQKARDFGLLEQVSGGLLIPRTYNSFHEVLSPSESFPCVKLYEQYLHQTEIPEPLSFLDWYLAMADPDQINYLLGRLLERSDPKKTPSPDRYQEIQDTLSQMGWKLEPTKEAERELEKVQSLLREGKTDDESLGEAKLSPLAVSFVKELSHEEIIWVQAYIHQKIVANKREDKKRLDEIYPEHMRQTDVDQFIFDPEFDSEKAKQTLQTVLGRLGGKVASVDLDDPRAVIEAVEEYFNDHFLWDRRKRMQEAYRQLAENNKIDPFTDAELLYAFLVISSVCRGSPTEEEWESVSQELLQSGDFDKAQVDRFITRLDIPTLDEADRTNLYQYAFTMTQSRYLTRVDGYLRSLYQPTQGMLDKQMVEGNDIDYFWKWLSGLVGFPGDPPSDLQPGPSLKDEMDKAIADDLGNDLKGKTSQLDWPTESIVRDVLKKVKSQLEGATPTDPEIAKKVELLAFLQEALFGEFDLTDEKARALHSRYNSNGFVPPPVVVSLVDIYNIPHLNNLVQRAPLLPNFGTFTDRKYNKGMGPFLWGLLAVLSDDTLDSIEMESTIENVFNERKIPHCILIIQGFLTDDIFNKLRDESLVSYQRAKEKGEPIDLEKIQSKFDALRDRLQRRIVELETEDCFQKLEELWNDSSRPAVSFLEVLPKKPESLTQEQKEKSDHLIVELKGLRVQLQEEQKNILVAAQHDYREELIRETETAVILLSDFQEDPGYVAKPTDSSFDLEASVIIPTWPEPLFGFQSEPLSTFAAEWNKSVQDILERGQTVSPLREEYFDFLSVRDINYMLILLHRMKRDLPATTWDGATPLESFLDETLDSLNKKREQHR